MVKSSDPNHDIHDFHKIDETTSKSPPFTSTFPLELETFESFQGKVLYVIKYYGDIHKSCPRSWIVETLKDHMNYDQVNTAIKELQKKSLIHSPRYKCWKFGKKIVVVGGTHGSGASYNGTDKSVEEEVFRLLNSMPYVHNVQGKIEVKYWGKIEPNKTKDWEFVKDLGDGAYIKLKRQGFTLQFYLANKRPGYDLGHLLACIRAMYDLLYEFELFGKILIDSFEMREQQLGVVADLKGNPIDEVIFGNILIRFYQEEGILNKEIRPFNQNLSFKDLIEFIANIELSLKPQVLIDKVVERTERMELKVIKATESLLTNQKDFSEIQKNESAEVMELRINTAHALEIVEDVSLITDKVSGTLEKIEVQVNGLQTTVSELEVDGGSNTKILDNQTRILDKLADKVISIESELKKEREENRLWRELDNAARLEEIKEYRELNYSWSRIADKFETHKKGPWELLKTLDPDYYEQDKLNRLNKEKVNQLRKRHMEVNLPPSETVKGTVPYEEFKKQIKRTTNFNVLKEIVRIIKQNSGMTRSSIKKQLSIKFAKQKFLWIIKYLVESNKVIAVTDQKHSQKQILYFNFRRW